MNEYEGIAKGDIVLYTQNGDITTIIKAQTITGTPGKLNGTKVTIGGTTYDVSKTAKNVNSGITSLDAKTDVGFTSEYTLYLDQTGKNYVAIVGKTVDKESDVVFVVGAYQINEGYDEYGQLVGDSYYVQAVDMSGNKVVYQTEDDDFGGAASKVDTPVNKLFSVSTSYDSKSGITYATFEEVKDSEHTNVTISSTSAVRFTGTNDYFTSDVKFIYVDGSYSKLDVTVKEGVQKLDKKTVYYVAEGNGTNKTVDVVIVAEKYEPETATQGTDIMFVPNKAAGAKVPYEDANGTQTGTEYTVYIDGVKETIVVASDKADVGTNGNVFVDYTIEDGIYTLTGKKTDKNLFTEKEIDNVFNSLITTTVADDKIIDMPADDAVIISLLDEKTDVAKLEEKGQIVPTVASELYKGLKVSIVLDTDCKNIVTVYVTGITDNVPDLNAVAD